MSFSSRINTHFQLPVSQKGEIDSLSFFLFLFFSLFFFLKTEEEESFHTCNVKLNDARRNVSAHAHSVCSVEHISSHLSLATYLTVGFNKM